MTSHKRSSSLIRRCFYIGSVFAGILSTAVSASTSEPGYVTNDTMEESTWTNFTQNGVRTSLPNCTTDARWSIDMSTEYGRTRLAALLTAMAANKKVYIVGTGICGGFGIETINYFTVLN